MKYKDKFVNRKETLIFPEMTVLDVISKYRKTEAVFKLYDRQACECVCCQALFETLQDVAKKYDFSLEKLLSDLETAAGHGSKTDS